MKREMYQITVEALDTRADIVKISQEDPMSDGGEHSIYISVGQVELLRRWLKEAVMDIKV